MEESLRTLVRERAGYCCEYCGSPERDERFYRHHMEHIVPRKHGGLTAHSNLALGCRNCNLHKGPNLTGIDPETRQVALLFNPRTQLWSEHFVRRGVMIVGITPVGRATVEVFGMNSDQQLHLRSISEGRS